MKYLRQHWLEHSKTLYRIGRWHYLKFLSKGWLDRTINIRPQEIILGQKPESQFPPKRFLGGYRSGEWDLEVLAVEDHPLYKSYVQHFSEGESWENTPFFKSALATITEGKAFRGEYKDLEALRKRFKKCDTLFDTIRKQGYKSNHQLYAEGLIDNILDLMDEVTVNIGREGNYILNDGWHRFATVRVLGVQEIPARLCALHTKAPPLQDLIRL